jgi:hypothetical protein
MKITPPVGGVFSPIVKFTAGLVGQKKFNTVRGKAISKHSHVINDFCKYVGAGQKLRQDIIRLAKTNGKKLGFIE